MPHTLSDFQIYGKGSRADGTPCNDFDKQIVKAIQTIGTQTEESHFSEEMKRDENMNGLVMAVESCKNIKDGKVF